MMHKKLITILLTVLTVTALMMTACSNADEPTEEELALAVELTLAAQPTEAEADVPPTETPVPEPTATPEPTNTPEPTAIPHSMIPGEPPEGAESQINDVDSSNSAAESNSAVGEAFNYNLLERPFTSETMDYHPDLDITGAKLNTAEDFIFVEITLQGEHADGGLQGTYGVELDLNNDGSGDVLILASNLQSDWSTDGVFAWKDSNSDVGGGTPITTDETPGNGYDTVVFEEAINADDTDLVWARISPSDAAVAQLAFKPALIDDASSYIWWAVADNMVMNPALYDYNDHFTLEEAGSPVAGLVEYPVKALAEIDNTCGWGVGELPEHPNARMCGGIASLLASGQDEEVTVQVYPSTNCSGPAFEFSTLIVPDVNFAGVSAGAFCVRVLGLECDAGVAAQVVTFPLDGDFDWGLFCRPQE